MIDDPTLEQEQEFAEEEASLIKLTFGPLIWAGHFVLSYWAAAVVCAKFPAAITPLRWAIAGVTLPALAGILWLAWLAWRQWDFFDRDQSHDRSGERRHAFLGQAAFLLTVPSFIGTVYTALPALFAGTCR